MDGVRNRPFLIKDKFLAIRQAGLPSLGDAEHEDGGSLGRFQPLHWLLAIKEAGERDPQGLLRSMKSYGGILRMQL